MVFLCPQLYADKTPSGVTSHVMLTVRAPLNALPVTGATRERMAVQYKTNSVNLRSDARHRVVPNGGKASGQLDHLPRHLPKGLQAIPSRSRHEAGRYESDVSDPTAGDCDSRGDGVERHAQSQCKTQTTGARGMVDGMPLHNYPTARESGDGPNAAQAVEVSTSRTGGAHPPTGATEHRKGKSAEASGLREPARARGSDVTAGKTASNRVSSVRLVLGGVGRGATPRGSASSTLRSDDQ